MADGESDEGAQATRPRRTTRARSRPRARPDASMSLLNDLLRNPLDADYAEAHAAQSRHHHGRSSTWLQRGVVFILAVALAIVTVWGVRQLRLPEAASARQTLEKEAVARSGEVDAQREQVAALQQQLSDLRAAALPGQPLDEGTTVAAATTAVKGPGLVVTLDDAPAAKNDPEADADLLVHDSDVQAVVNGLWGAGAEAIAVNGHRLTSLSTIRSAGSAIQVDLVSLSPPYLIQAIGDPNSLEHNLDRTPAKARLALLSGRYGIPVHFHTERTMKLPGAAVTGLRYTSAEGSEQ